MNLKVAITILSICLIFASCKTNTESKDIENIIEEKPLSVQLAESDILRFTQLMSENPHWGYHQGLIGKSMLDMWEYTGEQKYFDFVKTFGENVIKEDGHINTYELKSYNIDNINSGKLLIPLYQKTNDERYVKAIDTLIKQLASHPRTSEGGYWHKLRYPHQKWLDGIYMASPFLSAYAKAFDQPAYFDDVVNQITLMARHAYHPEKMLLYHGWDESREQPWANKETGLSANFWSRSIGWYAMAIVDVLDFLPKEHSGRQELIEIAKNVAEGIRMHQDKSTGAWYQVTDLGDREGNYLESSGTAMFVYFLYKGIRMGYLSESYLVTAQKGYEGLVSQFFKTDENGIVSVSHGCIVAGLGGPDNRDGSFEYYISEPVKDNDPKATAPAIMASIEHERSIK
ncbi:glycoside hydrolase family 88 protein [Belliella sp. DSM 111904]|uniref:Glycoside hydrolase family 88 protein n=1 Tax=Belliella filtrata TaxID=2923435 RepID=A0ABS9UWC7_9BACT|nr:glycoside hydrolase family 88 protein [Belliella filtrata]MCH7408070.1 glycoside hydrolase family 88 protein [Belliella filtrata]